MATVSIALGSNLGDRAANIAAALSALAALPGTDVLKTAKIYETQPVGGPAGQGDYLNSACLVETTFEPLAFLAALHRIERDLGRHREEGTVRWGPRTIDLDILLWDDMLVDLPELTIPHPRRAEREFVLRPLCDIAPNAAHPALGLTMRQLLERIAPTP